MFAGDDDDDDDDDVPVLDAARPNIHGIHDLSATKPDADVDLFRLDVPEAGVWVIETDGYDPIAVDTFLELWIGPDQNGDFMSTGIYNDDVSPGDFRSRIETPLVPACEALELDCSARRKSNPAPSYWISVSSAFVVPNFPYELRAGRSDSLFAEFADFGDCGSGLEAQAHPGARFTSRIDSTQDLDGYRFRMEQTSAVRIRTAGANVDTTLQLVDRETGQVVAYDDDGNPGAACPSGLCSQVERCLSAGVDYCVRVGAFGGVPAFDYEIELIGGEPCEAVERAPLAAASGCSPTAGNPDSALAACESTVEGRDRAR